MTFKNLKLKLPDGSIQEVKYPEEWTEEQIKESVFKHMPQYLDKSKSSPQRKEDSMQSPEERTGLSGVIGDVGRGLGNAVKSAKNSPDSLRKSGKYIEENPGESILHNAGQLAAGAGDLAKGLANAPADFSNYLLKKEFHPAEIFGRNNKVEGEQKPSNSVEDILKSLTKNKSSSFISNFANALTKHVVKNLPKISEDTGVENSLGLKADKDKGDEVFRNIPNIAALGTGITSLGRDVKNLATAPSKERRYQRSAEEKIDKAEEKTKLSEQELKSFQDALKLKYSKEHPGSIGELTPVGQQIAVNEKTRKIGDLSESASKAEQGKIPVEPDVKGAEKALSDALDSTRNHEKHGGRLYQKALLEDKAATSKLYDDYRAHLNQHEVKVDNRSEIKDVSKTLNEMKNNDELAPGYGSGTDEQKALETHLKNLENETVNAEDIFAVKRTLDHMADKTRDKQYSGVDDTEFKRLRLIAESLESQSGKLDRVLESVGSPEARKMIKLANHGWSKYSGAKNHPVGRKALKEGLLPSNTIGKLESTHRGSEYLNSIKDASPQLQKHILSQKYGKPSQFKHLLEPKEEVESYLANREDLHGHIENLRETKHAKEQHQSLVTAMKDAATVKSLGQQIEFHHNAIPGIEAKMKKVDANSAEHKRLQKELDDHKKNIADKNHLLKKYGSLILKATGVSTLLHKIGLH